MGLACAVFIGVLLAPIGCWLRLSLENDVPEPVRNKKAATSESAFSLLLQHKATIVNGVLLAIGSTVATYISLFYYGTWAAKYLAMPQHYSHAAMLLAGVVTFVGALLVGMLCDSVGRKKLILISRVMVLLCSWPSFWLLVNYPSPGMLLTVVFVMVSFTTLGGVPVMLLISELLPKRIRALGFALVYSIGVAIFGGFAQYFATQSIVLLDSLTAPAWYLGRHVAVDAGVVVRKRTGQRIAVNMFYCVTVHSQHWSNPVCSFSGIVPAVLLARIQTS